MATIEERFQAAVNVIKGLPKNGPYQPSTGMMLKFYGYYKQATEGPCLNKKPNFWDVVGKAKWDAWNDNRHLTKQQAMQKYVDDLREIIETMSFTENVQNFVGSISALDNINLDELDMVVPGMREIAESHPNSPFNSRTNSPQHGTSANGTSLEPATMNGHAHMNGDANSDVNGGPTPPPSTPVQEENEDEIQQQQAAVLKTAAEPIYTNGNNNVDQSDDEYADPVDMNHDLTEAILHNSELLKQIQATVLRMNADLVTINQRMGLLEKTVQDVRTVAQKNRSSSLSRAAAARQYPKWWPFKDISPAWFVLLVLWPFAVKRFTRMLSSPPRRK